MKGAVELGFGNLELSSLPVASSKPSFAGLSTIGHMKTHKMSIKVLFGFNSGARHLLAAPFQEFPMLCWRWESCLSCGNEDSW